MGEEKDKKVGAEPTIEAPEITIEDETVEETKESKEKKSKKKKKPTSDELLLEIQEELTELKEKYFRKLAEMENYKKRVNDDLLRERKYAGYSLANKLIDSLEIFNQALNMETNDPNLKNFLYGFKMIDEMIFNSLKDEGVSLIETKIGDVFDPTKQEAVDKEYDPEKPEHTVLRVQKKGYMFKDRILRPSMVIINIKPEETISEATQEELENQSKNNETNE
ncbi:MAG: nucleotide exchange factor GrpE [Bacilli bacterium]|nr:nucleotide exchange factor GrpE [Bacilli bacterium]MBN2877914.1 nucleotide exchange factor GrpE [Bacilli bacterium]